MQSRNMKNSQNLEKALDSSSQAIRNLLSVGIQGMEPAINQAVSTAMAPVMAMVSQLVRDIHEVKRDLGSLRPIQENLVSVGRKVDRIEKSLGSGVVRNATELSVEAPVPRPEENLGHGISMESSLPNASNVADDRGDYFPGLSTLENGYHRSPSIKLEEAHENPEEILVFDGESELPTSSGTLEPYSNYSSLFNSRGGDEQVDWRTSHGPFPEFLSVDFNQKKRDELGESLLGKNHRAVKQVIMETLGILECEEDQFEQFSDMLQVGDVEKEEEEGERRSIPGIHYPVVAPGFNFTTLGCFQSILTPRVIRAAQMQMKRTVNPLARAKAFAWKMVILFFDKRQFNLKTFKFCIRQTLDDADSTLGQCSAFIAKIVRLAISIYENPQIMAREELKIRTNEILIQLHKNVSKVSAEMRGCTWNSSSVNRKNAISKRKAHHIMTGNANPTFLKKKTRNTL